MGDIEENVDLHGCEELEFDNGGVHNALNAEVT